MMDNKYINQSTLQTFLLLLFFTLVFTSCGTNETDGEDVLTSLLNAILYVLGAIFFIIATIVLVIIGVLCFLLGILGFIFDILISILTLTFRTPVSSALFQASGYVFQAIPNLAESIF